MFQLSNTESRHEQLGKITDLQKKEIRKIEAVISAAEGEQLSQKKEFSAVLAQRNILSTQLMRRNTELGDVQEKIKITGSTLAKAEAHYKKDVGDVEALKKSVEYRLNVIKKSGEFESGLTGTIVLFLQ